MEFKEIQGEFHKLRKEEEIITVSYLKSLSNKKFTSLDLSNYYIFEKGSKLLLKLLKTQLSSKRRIKSLILKNCMISSLTLTNLLKLLVKYKSSLTTLDISNNRLPLDPIHSEFMSLLFSSTSRLKSLNFQGNLCNSPLFFRELYSQDICLSELNLYDTNLSAEGLLTISKILSLNKIITSLNLGYNSAAFENFVNINTFASSVSENSNIQFLTLSENLSLGRPDNLMQLCLGLKGNRSLQVLDIGGIDLGDTGMDLVVAYLLNEMPLPGLNLSNNNIQDEGILRIISQCPNTLTYLDISYNNFRENSTLIALSSLLKETKSLRKLNLSHCLELRELNESCANFFCDAITVNDSLSKLLCEGIKVAEEPEKFCKKISEAIGVRKLSLTYKISAVSYVEGSSMGDSIVSNGYSMKVLSKVPSNVWAFRDSQASSFTERKDYIDSPNQEPIIDTSRQFTFSTSFE